MKVEAEQVPKSQGCLAQCLDSASLGTDDASLVKKFVLLLIRTTAAKTDDGSRYQVLCPGACEYTAQRPKLVGKFGRLLADDFCFELRVDRRLIGVAKKARVNNMTPAGLLMFEKLRVRPLYVGEL